ncbi:MAG: RagB/SusD family nutrient uptake outer membrane protein [Bacteroidales bacterium]|nr:RagB/SusD family nutrient uptake outer membrane protein [Bacteroidales bacterium]
MKNILKYIICIAFVASSVSCEKFLDSKNLTKKDTSNFPTTATDAEQLVIGIYTAMNQSLSDPESYPFYVYEEASDDRLGGGSTSNIGAQCCDRIMNKGTDYFKRFWECAYAGIFRANNVIATIDNVEKWPSQSVKDNLLAEAHFLRGYYLWDLASMFQSVPMPLQTVAENLPKAATDDIYKQIGSDMLKAISLFSSTKVQNDGSCGGRATKWAAESILARIWMFYTGFYNKSEMPTNEGSISKSDIIKHLEDCIKNSGHDLIPDQRNLWPYSNPYTTSHYPWAKDKNLNWVGDGSIETVFAIKFSNQSDFGSSTIRHNRIAEFFSPRKGNTVQSYPWGNGYSNGPASVELWESWAKDENYRGDPRREGAICDRRVEMPDYGGDPSKEVENTYLHAKKQLVTACYDNEGKLHQSYAFMYGGKDDKQLGITQDIILMRFADVLLMHAELTETATNLNRVRQRSGLKDVTYSFDNLVKERRYELCFEGVRWNDLRRWHLESEIVRTQVGQPITNRGKDDVYSFEIVQDFLKRYKETGGGFWKIPESQVTLSQGVLEQNPGWGDEYTWVKLDYPTLR